MDLIRAVNWRSNEDDRPAKRGRLDGVVTTTGGPAAGIYRVGANTGNGTLGFVVGRGSYEDVTNALLHRHDLHNAVVTKGDLRVESTAGGAAFAVREITSGESEKIAFLKARAVDDAKYVARVQTTNKELGDTIDNLTREDRKNKAVITQQTEEAMENKAVITQLSDTLESVLEDNKVLEAKNEDDKDLINILAAALRFFRFQGKEAAEYYLSRFPKARAMVGDEMPPDV